MIKQYSVRIANWFHSSQIFKSENEMTFAKLYPYLDTKINVRDHGEKRKSYINSSDKI